jgi:dihydrofolate reductase
VTRVRVESFTISVDGFGAGPDQSMEQPLGAGGESLHGWVIATRSWREKHGMEGGTGGIDDSFAARAATNVGAFILGRNMFGPVRGPWLDSDWQGWWGRNPPFRAPVFVLTHHARPSLPMDGGTTFHFVNGGIQEALDRAREAANGLDIQIGGGVSTIQQFLRARVIDELHVAIVPVLLGRGERLFDGVDLQALGYRCVQFTPSEKATHVVIRKEA